MMPATEQTPTIGQQIEALQAQYRHLSSEITPLEDQIERLEAELADLRELRNKVHRQIRELALESLTPHINPAPGPEEAFPDELIGNTLDPLRDFGRRKEQQLLDEIRYPTCVCGHEIDEHDGVECAVEDCDCIHYEGDA